MNPESVRSDIPGMMTTTRDSDHMMMHTSDHFRAYRGFKSRLVIRVSGPPARWALEPQAQLPGY